jgi:hypothetical protein
LKEDSKPSYQKNKKKGYKDTNKNSKLSEKYGNKINSVTKIKINEFNTIETFEMQRKNQVSKLKGNGYGIQMMHSGTKNGPRSELSVIDDQLPVKNNEQS